MALVQALRELDAAGELRLVAVAHVNHQLRDAADSDEQFCRATAAAVGLPFICERVDVRAKAREAHRSLEDAAHIVRHAFFSRAAAQHRADAVALGHTQDDQAETFLLRLIRGAGTRGLAGMYPRRGIVIRPLLECSRSDVLTFLESRGVAFVKDVSNDDLSIPRNRVRAELLPLLTSRFNRRVNAVLAAEAELARLDEELLGDQAASWIDAHVAHDRDSWTLDRNRLAALPRALGWRVLHALLTEASGGRPIGSSHVKRAWSSVVDDDGQFDGPGQRVKRAGQKIVLKARPAGFVGRVPADAGQAGISEFFYPLAVPGETAIPEIGRVVSAEIGRFAESGVEPNGVTAVVPKEMVAGGLAVRNRRAGDRLRPSAAGHKKVQDLLVDRKVPRHERDGVPIVVDHAGRIVWVAGHALDWDFRVSDPVQAVVILRLKGVGGSF
jgi:tRNA(Ile)-lysidine synthase